TRVLHYQCADAINDGSLRIILANFEVEPLPVHLLHAARGALPAKLRVFLDFAAGRLRGGFGFLCSFRISYRPRSHSLEDVRVLRDQGSQSHTTADIRTAAKKTAIRSPRRRGRAASAEFRCRSPWRS